MNSINALGFLALGSLMNALPALAPALVDRGGFVVADLSPSALWLHLMGFVVGAIGGSALVRESLAQTQTAPRVPAIPAARPVAVPHHIAPRVGVAARAQAAA